MSSRRDFLKLSTLGTASFAAPFAYSSSDVTMTFQTGNPVPSKDPRDLLDNAESFDIRVTSRTERSTPDRLGVPRKTWHGMELDFAEFLAASGFEPMHLAYQDGAALQVDRPTQLIDYNSSVYRVKIPANFPVMLSGSWATDAALLVDVGDESLRQDIAGAVTIVRAGGVDDSGALISANFAGKPVLISGVARAVGVVLTVPLVDTLRQIFTTDSTVTIASGQPVRPEWFGDAAGNIRLAVNALPAFGGVVQLENKTYPHSYSMDSAGQGAGVAYLAKPYVKLVGRKLPSVNAAGTALEGGTVVQGPMTVNADHFEVDLIGLDSGKAVCDTLWSGVTPDALNLGAPISRPNNGLRIGHIVSLGYSPNSPMHGVLIENYSRVDFDHIAAHMCSHGLALKASGVTGRLVSGTGNGADTLVIKSNDYAPCADVSIEAVYSESHDGVIDSGMGLYVLADNQDSWNINIGRVVAARKARGALIHGATHTLSLVSIGSISATYCSEALVTQGNLKSVDVGEVIANATEAITTQPGTDDGEITVARLVHSGGNSSVAAVSGLRIGEAIFKNIAGHCITLVGGVVRLGNARYINSPLRINDSPIGGWWRCRMAGGRHLISTWEVMASR